MSSNTKEGNSSGVSGGGKGGIGSKLKGAAQVVHGIGESIRGTVLGAADTITHSPTGEAKNEAIASKGKAEFEEGLSKIRGSGSGGVGKTGGLTGVGSAPGVQGAGGVGKATGSAGRDSSNTSMAAPVAGEGAREGDAIRKGGGAKEETRVPGAYQHSPPAETNGKPETYLGEQPPPQPKSYEEHTKPSTEQHDGEKPEGDTKEKPLPERPRGRIFTGAEGERAEREQPQKWAHEDEGAQPKKESEMGKLFTGSHQSTGSSQGVTGNEPDPREGTVQKDGKREDLIGEGADVPQGPGSSV